MLSQKIHIKWDEGSKLVAMTWGNGPIDETEKEEFRTQLLHVQELEEIKAGEDIRKTY